MTKATDQIKIKIGNLLDELNLGAFKKKLLNGLKFNYRLQSYEEEDYSKLGNTRLGGLPDLPKNIEYPYNDDGYYNLLCQINFSDFEVKLDKLPEEGILYVFNGHSSENDFVTIYSESDKELEKKYPPKGMKNLNEEVREEVYDGLKSIFEIEHYFDGTLYEIYKHDESKYQILKETNSKFSTHVLGSSMDDVCHIYLQLKGFDTITHTALLYFRGEEYDSQFKIALKNCEEALNKPDTNKEYFKRKKEQLLKLDREREQHFNYYSHVTCLVGLESLDRLDWMWSDMGFKYLYILSEDLKKKNFDNMIVQWWSS